MNYLVEVLIGNKIESEIIESSFETKKFSLESHNMLDEPPQTSISSSFHLYTEVELLENI